MSETPLGHGTVLGGRYRLDVLLSENAGARFWRGTDTVLGRSVAVNTVPATDPRSGDVVDAARASATVNDAHLLHVLDCTTDDDLTWVVNEWGEGVSLDVMLQQHPLPAGRAAWLAREVASTIAAAHAVGVAHGRLAPEAVLVTRTGAVKLIGMAISAAIEGSDHGRRAATAQGYGELGPLEADVIDLAGILYAALTGRWPGLSPSDVPAAPSDQRGPLRPRQVRAGVPRMLDAICERVLRKEAHEHLLPIETAHEVHAALSDEVGDPVRSAPVSVASLYVEPSASVEVSPSLAAGTGSGGTVLDGEPGSSAALAPDDVEPTATVPVGDPGAARAVRGADQGADLGEVEMTQVAAPPVWDDTDDHPPLEGAAAPVEEAAAVHAEVPAPIPPFEEGPERPLFASTERRPPVLAPPSAAWPEESPARHHGRVDHRSRTRRRRRRRALLLASLAVLLTAAIVAAAFAVLDHRHHTDQTATTGGTHHHGGASQPSGARINPVSVRDFDPQGDPPSENPDEVPLATDRSRTTGWQTSTYRGSAALGGIKTGVGLLLDLGADRSVATVRLVLTGSPTSVSLYGTPPGTTTPPSDLTGTTELTHGVAHGTTIVLHAPGNTHARYLVIWLTRLPAVSGGYRGQIDDITVTS